nr:DNA binding protein [Microvirus sp.]
MFKRIYIIKDTTSGAYSEAPIVESSDASFIRSFGYALVQQGLPKRFCHDLQAVCIGELVDDGRSVYPSLKAYSTPVPICTGFEALCKYIEEYSEEDGIIETPEV